jgi:hypothetical protein
VGQSRRPAREPVGGIAFSGRVPRGVDAVVLPCRSKRSAIRQQPIVNAFTIREDSADHAGRRAGVGIAVASTQLTAFFTSAPILSSSAAVNPFSAKATGHKAPSSRFALSLKPNVAYLALNL